MKKPSSFLRMAYDILFFFIYHSQSDPGIITGTTTRRMLFRMLFNIKMKYPVKYRD